MADINKIINAMNLIGGASYKGRATSRTTLHRENFDRLQGSARQVAVVLMANPAPGPDTLENLKAQFNAMKKAVDGYCTNTAGTEDVLSAWNKAWSEWQLLLSGH